MEYFVCLDVKMRRKWVVLAACDVKKSYRTTFYEQIVIYITQILRVMLWTEKEV